MTRTIQQVLSDVRRLAAEYHELTGKPLGVTGEVAEYEAARLLGMKLSPPRTAGFDAVDGKGRKIQIKGRRLPGGSTAGGRVGTIKVDSPFDAVQLVLLGEHYEAVEIWEADRAAVIDRLEAPGSRARNERGQLDVSQFKSIAVRVWPPG